MADVIKALDGAVATIAFGLGLWHAVCGEWRKATFYMTLSISCEIGYRMT